jgi:hypothetical protein
MNLNNINNIKLTPKNYLFNNINNFSIEIDYFDEKGTKKHKNKIPLICMLKTSIINKAKQN